MGYNNYGNSNSGGYNRPQGGSNYNQGGNGGYNKTQYQPPQKKEFNLDEEVSKYGMVYLALRDGLEAQGISLEEVKDYMGGWTTSLKINLDKS